MVIFFGCVRICSKFSVKCEASYKSKTFKACCIQIGRVGTYRQVLHLSCSRKLCPQPHCSEEKATLKTKSVGKIPERHFSSQTNVLDKKKKESGPGWCEHSGRSVVGLVARAKPATDIFPKTIIQSPIKLQLLTPRFISLWTRVLLR